MPSGVCQDCGTERWKLHRHHIVPKSRGGTDEASNIALICGNCHEDRHGGSTTTDSLPWQLSQTPEAKAKKSKSMRLRWMDPEYRERVLASRQRAMTPEAIERRRVGTKATYAKWTPEQRAEHGRKISATKKGRSFKGDRWSLNWDACRGCQSTERKYACNGYCTLCNTRIRRGQPLGPPLLLAPKTTRWARNHDSCLDCGTSDRVHVGHGLCDACRSARRTLARNSVTP